MFSIMIYLSLPLAFLFHDIEEIAKRKRWARVNVDRIGGMFPNVRPMLVHLRDMSHRRFCIHLLVHVVQAMAIRGYVPGLATTILLMPYLGIAVTDMLQQFSWQQNLLYAVLGTIVIIINLLMMHVIVRK